jgi:hypothetical protein
MLSPVGSIQMRHSGTRNQSQPLGSLPCPWRLFTTVLHVKEPNVCVSDGYGLTGPPRGLGEARQNVAHLKLFEDGDIAGNAESELAPGVKTYHGGCVVALDLRGIQGKRSCQGQERSWGEEESGGEARL